MFAPRQFVSLGAAVLAIALAGCGAVAVKPASGTRSRGQVDAPATVSPNHVACLQAARIPVRELSTTDLVIGTAPNLIRVHFDSTPGAAEAQQIDGQVTGAEAIGSALLYPGTAPDSELTTVEGCIAAGVKG